MSFEQLDTEYRKELDNGSQLLDFSECADRHLMNLKRIKEDEKKLE